MALSGDEGDALADSAEDSEMIEDTEPIRKNLLSLLDDDSPTNERNADGGGMAMLPPPVPNMNGKMQVFLRIRPLREDEKAQGEDQGCAVVGDPTRVDMVAPKESKTYEHSAHGCGKVINSFNFTKVYDEHTSQRNLFENCMLGTVKDFVDGQNCLVFAYGVTSSGKTYTMLGPPRDLGIIPRSLEVIFNSIGDKQSEHSIYLKPQCYCEVKRLSEVDLSSAEKLKTMIINSASKSMPDACDMYSSSDSLASMSSVGESILEGFDESQMRTSVDTQCQGNVKFAIWVSFAEIYNEQIHDLLEPLSKSSISQSKRKVMQLREDKNGNPFIKDLRHINVSTADEAIKVLTFGQRNLQYACTKLNESSSRGHCIFTVKIIRVVDKDNPSVARVSQLSFCDLAGSERYGRTGSTGDRLKEAANINTSLLILGRCLQILRKNQVGKTAKDKMVPFRESKLTRLFQTFFCGKGKASMFVNVSPAASSFDESIQALKFSAVAKQVQFVPEKIQPLPVKKTQLSLALEQEADGSRVSIPWASADELCEISKMEAVIEEDESQSTDCSTCVGYYQAIGKLREALIETNDRLKEMQREKRQIEGRLREEICQEMMQQLTEIDKQHEQEIAEARQEFEEAAEKKVKMVTSAIHKSVKRKRQEAEEETVSIEIYQALQVKLERKDDEVEDLQSKLQKVNEALSEIQQNSKEVREPLSDLENKENIIQRFQTELSQAKDEISALKLHETVLRETQAKLAEADKIFPLLKQKEAELMSFKTELEQANKVLSVVTQKEAEMETELKQATKIKEAHNEVSRLRDALRKMEDKLSGSEQNQQKVKALQEELVLAATERSSSISIKDAAIERLQNELTLANEELSCVKQKEDKVKMLRAELVKANEGQSRLKECDTELERLQTELAQAQMELGQAQTDLARQELKEGQVIELQRELAKVREGLLNQNQMDSELERLRIELAEANEERSCMKEREADVINSRTEEALSRLEQKQSEYEELRAELATSKQSLSDLETQMYETREKYILLKEKEDKVPEVYADNEGTKESKRAVPAFMKNLMKSVKSAVSLHSPSTVSIGSIGSHHTPVKSTCATPYKAMHTKSSLLRLQAAQDSMPDKVDKCLDHSCFANNDAVAMRNARKRVNIESETRATKKRKSATKKKRTSMNVIKRVYQTRSRAKS